LSEIDIEKEDFKNVLSTKSGIRFVAKLIDMCGVFRTSFSSDPIKTAFMEGQRNIGLYLLDKAIDIDRKFLYNIQEEFKNGKQSTDENR